MYITHYHIPNIHPICIFASPTFEFTFIPSINTLKLLPRGAFPATKRSISHLIDPVNNVPRNSHKHSKLLYKARRIEQMDRIQTGLSVGNCTKFKQIRYIHLCEYSSTLQISISPYWPIKRFKTHSPQRNFAKN